MSCPLHLPVLTLPCFQSMPCMASVLWSKNPSPSFPTQAHTWQCVASSVAAGLPLGSIVITSFFFFFYPCKRLENFLLIFLFFSPLTFTLEIISLLFCFLFYLFVSVFLTEEVIVFLEMCNACGKTVRSGGGAAWL